MVLFFWVMKDIDFFTDKFDVRSLRDSPREVMAALYLVCESSTNICNKVSQLVLRRRPGMFLVATLIAVFANWGFAKIRGRVQRLGITFWRTRLPLQPSPNYGKEEREAQWTAAQRTCMVFQPPETTNLLADKSSYMELSKIAKQAKRWAEVARLRELHTLKGYVESVVKLKVLTSTQFNSITQSD
ncbi:hypothetical protein Pfo_010620 [Paulownia fortunei]|nr:hypothetical protein Pfo_010620 [Paulownia fortunei]